MQSGRPLLHKITKRVNGNEHCKTLVIFVSGCTWTCTHPPKPAQKLFSSKSRQKLYCVCFAVRESIRLRFSVLSSPSMCFRWEELGYWTIWIWQRKHSINQAIQQNSNSLPEYAYLPSRVVTNSLWISCCSSGVGGVSSSDSFASRIRCSLCCWPSFMKASSATVSAFTGQTTAALRLSLQTLTVLHRIFAVRRFSSSRQK